MWKNRSKTTDISALGNFADQDHAHITAGVINQARELVISVYINKDDAFEGSVLGKLRVYKFLNNKSTLLKLLPPTENAFLQHLRCAALATMIDKSANVCKPIVPPYEKYGWVLDNGKLVPVASTRPAYPQQITKTISCDCTKGCNRSCSRAKNNIACYISCRCKGSVKKCSRAMYAAKFDSSESSESESDN